MKDSSYIDKYVLNTIHERQEQIAKYLSRETTKNITADNVRELIIPEMIGSMVYKVNDSEFESFFNIKKIDENTSIFLSTHFLGYAIPTYKAWYGKFLKSIKLVPLLQQEYYNPSSKPENFLLDFTNINNNGRVYDNNENKIGSFKLEKDITKQEGMQVFLTDSFSVLLNRAKAYDKKEAEVRFIVNELENMYNKHQERNKTE